MGFIFQISTLATLLFGCVVLQTLGDANGWYWPWYFMHQVILALVPMAFLMWRTLPKATREQRLAFVTTSAFFIALSGALELVAIENRYWWFFTQNDALTGLKMGGIPIEEFLFYPLFLNIPVLLYLHLASELPSTQRPRPLSARARRVLFGLAGAFAAFGFALIARALVLDGPALDLTLLPVADGAGALRYATGPDHKGWTIIQTLATAACILMLVKTWTRLDPRRLVLVGAVFFVFTFFVELMACGRGWWVWNERQTLGIFTWVLPLDSYAMYLTGGFMPILFFELVRPFFAEASLPDERRRSPVPQVFPRPIRTFAVRPTLQRAATRTVNEG